MLDKTRVLVSGFKPFGGATVNPSELLMEALNRANFPDIELSTVVLPVEFDHSVELLLQKIEKVKPAVVIAFGQAEGRKAITPEKVAVNLDNARIPDNSGELRTNQPIDEHGKQNYASTLPIDEMVEAMKTAGFPAEVSVSAGTFVCNHLFYKLQKVLDGTSVRSGFVHVPLVTEQSSEFPDQFTMDLDDMVNAVRTAILSAV